MGEKGRFDILIWALQNIGMTAPSKHFLSSSLRFRMLEDALLIVL